VKARKVQI